LIPEVKCSVLKRAITGSYFQYAVTSVLVFTPAGEITYGFPVVPKLMSLNGVMAVILHIV